MSESPVAAESAPLDGATPMVRRFLTLMFCDLTDSTRWSAILEAEYYAELLVRLRDTYREVIDRHGGSIVSIQGDGVMALFGHPEALEDDGRRATEAALDLHALVRTLRVDVPLPRPMALSLHTGIHAGLVLVGRGDIVRGRFQLMGNAPNIAARLSDAALPDEILISEETLGAERHFFIVGGHREFTLQGAAAPLSALSIVARAGIGSRYEARLQRGLTTFVGRQAERSRLQQALEQTRSGTPRCMALAAEPGLGKTRLAHEFLDRCAASGCTVLRGYCESYSGAQPLQPLLQMLRALFGLEYGQGADAVALRLDSGLAAIAPALVEQRPALLQALSMNDPAAPARARHPPQAMLSALVAIFTALAAQRPLVLFFDDWQWADGASHQVVDTLRSLPDMRLLVLIAIRGTRGEIGVFEDTFEWIELAPLSAAESAQSVRRLLPAANPFLVDDICAYAGGNPLYLEELCHNAAVHGTSQPLGRLQGGTAWLRLLVEARVTRLPEAQGALVRSAAVMGDVVPVWLFERITGCSIHDPHVLALAKADLIYPGEQSGTLRFKHGITRDVIYEAVGLHQRRALHLQIAQALLDTQGSTMFDGENTLEALAYHFEAGLQFPEAATYAEKAGDKALASSALDRARAQYGAALAALERFEPTPELAVRWNAIMQRLGLVCVFDPSRHDLALFERALELARGYGSAAVVARAQFWLSYMLYALGDSLDAVGHAEQALQVALACGDDRLTFQVKATLGQALAAASRYAPAMLLLEEAIAVKQSHRSGAGPAVGLVYTVVCKAVVQSDRGEFALAHASFDHALTLVGTLHHEVGGSIRGWYAAMLLWQGHWAEAHRVATEGRRIGERVRSLFAIGICRTVAAYASWKLEPNDVALQQMAETLAWLAPRGNAAFTSLNHGWLADALADSGRVAEARAQAARALRRRRQRDILGAAMACRAMARLAVKAGDGGRARRWVARAMKIADERESAHERATTLLCSAEVEALFGRPDLARRQLAEAEAAFDAMAMTWHLEQARAQRRR